MPARRLRSIAGGSLGNLIEWFDWYAYSAFSLYFAKSFFPESDQTAQLLGTSGIFAAGFLMRPIGAWWLGILADKHGRRAALAASVAMMCFGSLMIALTPTYESIGVTAPFILLMARIIQGLSVGGEYGVSAAYLSEIAEPHRRGFWSSFQYVTLIMGQLLALGLLVLLQFVLIGEDALDAWGWRIPFVIGAMLAVMVFWIRRGIEETPSFLSETAEKKRRSKIRELLDHWRGLAFVTGGTIGSTVCFYAFTTYMQKFLVASSGFDRGTASLICSAALLLFMLIQPIGGALSDTFGRKPMLYVFGIGGVIGTVPVFAAIQGTESPLIAFLLIATMLVIMTGVTSTAVIVKAELFPTEVRALGIGLPYALMTAIFGGTAEFIALSFKSAGHESLFFWYVTAAVAISLFTFRLLPETRWASRISEGSTSSPQAGSP